MAQHRVTTKGNKVNMIELLEWRSKYYTLAWWGTTASWVDFLTRNNFYVYITYQFVKNKFYDKSSIKTVIL